MGSLPVRMLLAPAASCPSKKNLIRLDVIFSVGVSPPFLGKTEIEEKESESDVSKK